MGRESNVIVNEMPFKSMGGCIGGGINEYP